MTLWFFTANASQRSGWGEIGSPEREKISMAFS
jgi:hypothetical protein